MKSAPGQGTSSAAEEVLAGGGEMGALMRGLNWSRTPLGPVEDWPQSLRTAVSILLNSRHPMFIFWGPRLAKLYNDGYRPILGAKHPGALGQPGPEVWPEIWDTIGPMVEHVLSQGEATWSDDLMLFMHRNGYLEEVYFTFSYSPVRDETGGVGGMFCACIETTERVLGERRLRTLRDLAARAGETKTAADACRVAADTLANNAADIPFALLYLIDTGGKIARLVGAVGLAPNTPASPELVDLAAGESHDCWPMAAVADTGRAQLVDDLLARFGALSVELWPAPPHSALVLPIAKPGQDRPGGLLVAGISPRRALDDDYRGFFDLVAGQVATAVANARAYEEERRRTEALACSHRKHAERLRKLAAAALAINATLPLEALLQLITEQAGAIIGAHQAVISLTMNDNWQQPLNTIILSDKYAAWRGAAVRLYGSEIYALVCRENRPLRLTQAELDAHPAGRGVGDQPGGRLPMRGWLAAPLTTRDGRNMGLIQLSDKYEGEFTEEDESILVQLAQMASVAIENAQLYAAELQTHRYIQRNAERIAHLQTVTAMLAEALTPTEVAEVMVAQGLAALSARAGSVALLVDGDTALEIVSEFGYREELIDPWRRFSIDDHTPMSDAVRAASPVWLESLAERNARYPNLPPIASDDGGWVALPLLAKGRPIGAIGLSFAQPRIFDADDQAFMLTLAQQCAQALDRARLYVEAEAAVAARDELLSVVSHDLKNPLATVKGFAQLLRRRIVRLDSPEIVRLLDGLDKIDLAATRMGKQIAELLDATRLHAGQLLDLDRQPTNLVVLVRQVLAESQQTTLSHTIRLIAPDEELVGNYDSARLDRVFANLLQNAIKYSPQGGAIGVELAREERDGASWAIVAVSDQGIGIPADDLPQIFERFHRAGNVAGQIQGTGIGLSSASQIVEQHGGTIDVVSQEGVGSTFTVRLPLEPASSEF